MSWPASAVGLRTGAVEKDAWCRQPLPPLPGIGHPTLPDPQNHPVPTRDSLCGAVSGCAPGSVSGELAGGSSWGAGWPRSALGLPFLDGGGGAGPQACGEWAQSLHRLRACVRMSWAPHHTHLAATRPQGPCCGPACGLQCPRLARTGEGAPAAVLASGGPLLATETRVRLRAVASCACFPSSSPRWLELQPGIAVSSAVVWLEECLSRAPLNSPRPSRLFLGTRKESV